MSFYNFIFGVLHIEITSASPERLLSKFNDAEIALFDIKRVDALKLFAIIRRKDIKDIKRITEQEGAFLKVCRKTGLYWSLPEIRKRPILICAIIIWAVLTVFLPSRILFVEVNGNEFLKSEHILEAASQCGIAFGTERRTIRSEEFKNKMLEKIPQLQWLGVNTKGCVAKISVKEREENNLQSDEGEGNCIVAARDGVVSSATVLAGNTMVAVGDSVQKDQILISGWQDLGTFIRTEDPKGEIYADTSRSVTLITPTYYTKSREIRTRKTKFSILFGKNIINLFKGSGIYGTGCGRIYKKYTLTLPGGYKLPLSLLQYTEVLYESDAEHLSDPDAFRWLRSYSEDYLLKHMVAGTIQSRDEQTSFSEDIFCFYGTYGCNEMISKKTYKEFTEVYGKRN